MMRKGEGGVVTIWDNIADPKSYERVMGEEAIGRLKSLLTHSYTSQL